MNEYAWLLARVLLPSCVTSEYSQEECQSRFHVLVE